MKEPWKKSGLANVMHNLNKEIEDLKIRSMRGFIRGVIIIRRSMDMQSPLIPVDLGNLRSSWFVVTSTGDFASMASSEIGGEGRGFFGDNAAELAIHRQAVISAMQTAADMLSATCPVVIFGFSANYAVFVHENVGAHFQRPGAGAKFLTAAIMANKANIIKVVAEEAKIP